jgi:predicted phage terminase large subunit-like protein
MQFVRHPRDPREPGEALWPARYPLARLKQIRQAIGGRWWSAQYQGAPNPAGGSMFKREWFQIVEVAPADVRDRVRRWDIAATKDGGDYTVGARMSADWHGRFFIENVVRGQWSPGDVDRVMKQVAEIDTRETKQREEQEPGSSGKAVIAARARLLVGYDYRGLTSTGSKELRAGPFAAQCEAGNVFLVRGPWIDKYIDELVDFPTGKNDDQVDASSGAFEDLTTDEPMQVVTLQGFR